MVPSCARSEEPDLSQPFAKHTPIAYDGTLYGSSNFSVGRGWIVHYSKGAGRYQLKVPSDVVGRRRKPTKVLGPGCRSLSSSSEPPSEGGATRADPDDGCGGRV